MESRISGHTKLFCLIGSPVGHSGSPAMYNYTFERLGIDAAYLAFDIPLEQVEAGVEALKTLGVGGFNVTMPGQDRCLPPGGRAVPRSQTHRRLQHRHRRTRTAELTGHNTDGIGFVRNLHEHGVEVRGKKLGGAWAQAARQPPSACRPLWTAPRRSPSSTVTGYDFYSNGRH